jgi:3-methyladenine DNA glycosylase/8-oxoguanine DNA glycosylase
LKEARVAIAPFDLVRSFALGRFGLYDPTATLSQNRLKKAFSCVDGTCVVEVTAETGGVHVRAEGAGEAEVVADLVDALGADDGSKVFTPDHPLLAKLHRAHAGLRLVRVPWRFDVACCAVLQQRVTVREAWQEWTRIAKKYGTRPKNDGSHDLFAFPGAHEIARMDSWRFEELGVDPKRTRAMIGLARDVVRRGTFGWTDRARVRKHMRAVRGIGVWTTEMTLGFGYGDPDALPLADLHLPHLVTWALARERPGTDERMEQLLEPYRGHRFRAVRLLLDAGIVVPRA